MRHLLQTAQNWLEKGHQVALATVLETWGSAPRPIGAHLIIRDDGHFEGSVSGGCVEGAVVSEALDVLASHKPKILNFGVADENAWEVGLSCGGKIAIFVEPLKLPLLQKLNVKIAAREAVMLITCLEKGMESLETPQAQAKTQVQNNKLHTLFIPPLKMLITGAVHISQALVPLATSLGYAPVIIDPRTAFATPERFAGVTLHARWPQEIDLQLDKYTAFIALTHDPKIDDPALIAALHAECFYIGALGSKKTHAKRLARLAGLSGLERIHAPIGLDIGAVSPQEIALAIMAQVLSEARHVFR
jgi:xanthine dehydrogenase accessory factor